MIKVPEQKVHEIWDLLHKAHAIYRQAFDERIDIESTDWEQLRDKANTIDSDSHEYYNTPVFFFMDTIDQAISCEITYNDYLLILKCYGIIVA